MSRQVQRRKRSSSRPTAMQRLVLSWTRWRLSRMERRQQRLRARLAPVLVPLLQEQLELLAHPMLLAMGRLDDRQLETLQVSQQVFQVTGQLQVHQPMAEVKELLLEILASLQPTAEQQIAPLIGLPPRPTSPPSSES